MCQSSSTLAWAAVSMNRQGWLTRNDAGRVQGQTEIAATATPTTSTATTDPEVRHAN